jgi:hypothetical protein
MIKKVFEKLKTSGTLREDNWARFIISCYCNMVNRILVLVRSIEG